MNAELRTYRTARTAKRCNMHGCYRSIQPGDPYLRTSLPPLVEPNSSEHWWSLNVCAECVDGGGKPNSAMTADEWNERHPVGTSVVAYPGFRPEVWPGARRLETSTRTKAHSGGLDRDAVVWVEGHGAYIALTHIDVVGGAK